MTKTFKYIRNIHYYETDCMGITHHSNYIRIFEEARIDFMSKIGLAYDKLENLGIIIPVTGIDLEYKNVSKFAQILRIESAIVYFTGVRMTVQYKAYDNETDELICSGHSKHAFVDLNFKPFALQKKFPEIYQKFKSWNLNKEF